MLWELSSTPLALGNLPSALKLRVLGLFFGRDFTLPFFVFFLVFLGGISHLTRGRAEMGVFF